VSVVPDELPEGWLLARFGELLDFKGGSQPPKSEFTSKPCDGYIRLLQIRDFESDDHAVYIKDSTRWPKCEADDIMVGRYGASVGKVLSGKAGAYNVALVKMIFDQTVAHPDWVRQYLLSDFFQKPIRLLSRSAQNGFNKEELEEFDFPLPPLPEQRRIVAKIEALQARSRKAREALEAIPPLLEQFRQSVLAAAFRGDLTADWREQHPDFEPASVLLERIRAERRRKWEEAELAKFKAKGKVPKDDSWKGKYAEPEAVAGADLPELPEGWCWATWNHLSEWITYGFTRPMPHVENGIPIITAKNVVEGEVQFERTHFTTVEAFRALSDKDRPEAGDILITKDGTIGRAAVVPKGKQFCINQSVAVVYLRSCPIDRRYLLRLIEAPITQEPIKEKARGMALQHLSITDFGTMAVPLPPIEEQCEIVKHLESKLGRLERVVSEMKEAASSLAQLDQSILAKAFRGELVPQDPNDEPASVLLERIRAERADDTNGKPSRGRRKRQIV
jgi:type I restriction enzyme S subunit